MPEIKVRRWDSPKDGEFNEPLLKQKLEAKGYRVFCYTYSPGTYFGEHKHGESKIDAVVSGTFRMGMHGKFVDLGPGDWIEIPAGSVHSAEVIGRDPVVSLDAIKI